MHKPVKPSSAPCCGLMHVAEKLGLNLSALFDNSTYQSTSSFFTVDHNFCVFINEREFVGTVFANDCTRVEWAENSLLCFPCFEMAGNSFLKTSIEIISN